MFEEAMAMEGTLKLCRLTQEGLAKRMGVSQSYVANKLRLLGFSEPSRALILSHGLSERHARSILRLAGEENRQRMIERVATGRLTVRECEALVDMEVSEPTYFMHKRSERTSCIDSFRRGLRAGVEELCSLGIPTSVDVSHFGKKTYYTVCISEDE